MSGDSAANAVAVRVMDEEDWPSVRRIHEEGIATGQATFETAPNASEEAGLWTLQAGIFPENLASLRLHRACGFREVGRRERLGRLGDAWKDVLLLERRSPTTGL